MSDLAAIRGTFTGYRTYAGRKVTTLLIEVPLEQTDAAIRTLGGTPMPDDSRWVAVALLSPEAAAKAGGVEAAVATADPPPAKRHFADFPPDQQAGLLCNSADFAAYIKSCGWEGDAVSYIREKCGVKSRKEIKAGDPKWQSVLGGFDAWLATRAYGEMLR